MYVTLAFPPRKQFNKYLGQNALFIFCCYQSYYQIYEENDQNMHAPHHNNIVLIYAQQVDFKTRNL